MSSFSKKIGWNIKGLPYNWEAERFSYEGNVIELSKNEFIILRVLFEKQGDIAPREDLMNALWNSDVFVDDNTLSVTIARLRKRLGEIGIGKINHDEKRRRVWIGGSD